jgi:ferredoxin-thioredoxin reductase catalytic subunit
LSRKNNSAREFRARVIAENKPAFDLWVETCRLLEDNIELPRKLKCPADFAFDLLFLQVYKSMCSIYILAVRGHQEDAFTVLRRLLELAVQLRYLNNAQPGEINTRAEKYLRQDPDMRPHYWWGGTFESLFRDLGLEETYANDYRLLAQISHGVAKRNLFTVSNGHIQIRSAEHFKSLLIFSVFYTLEGLRVWNGRFKILSEEAVEKLVAKSLENYSRLQENLKTHESLSG